MNYFIAWMIISIVTFPIVAWVFGKIKNRPPAKNNPKYSPCKMCGKMTDNRIPLLCDQCFNDKFSNYDF